MAKKLKLQEKNEDVKEILFDILQKEWTGEMFEVSFEGSGDSGQIDNIDLPKDILKLKIEGCQISSGTTWDVVAKTSIERIENATVETAIENICYDVLERQFGGWENNDGAYGTFFFDVKNRKVKLEFNERVMDVKSTDYTF
jgi:hypothetical protein